MRYRNFVLCLAVFAIAGGARSEPDPIAKYLIDEPVSLLDFGIFRLNEAMRQTMASEYRAIGSAIYDWSDNKILLRGFSTAGAIKNNEDAKMQCKKMIDSVRYLLGVSADTGESVFGKNSMIHQYFQHRGYKTTSEPEDLADHLVKMVEIQVGVAMTDGTKIECRGPLMSTIIYFSP